MQKTVNPLSQRSQQTKRSIIVLVLAAVIAVGALGYSKLEDNSGTPSSVANKFARDLKACDTKSITTYFPDFMAMPLAKKCQPGAIELSNPQQKLLSEQEQKELGETAEVYEFDSTVTGRKTNKTTIFMEQNDKTKKWEIKFMFPTTNYL